MAKGYWIANVDIRDPEAYETYKAANAEPLRAFGAKFLVCGGPQTEIEGAFRPRSVVIEFPSYEAAVVCYHSDAYRAAKAIRD